MAKETTVTTVVAVIAVAIWTVAKKSTLGSRWLLLLLLQSVVVWAIAPHLGPLERRVGFVTDWDSARLSILSRTAWRLAYYSSVDEPAPPPKVT
jgi:hypothetical protein